MNAFEQGLLRHLSHDQLKKIQVCRVGIGGAGGLGSNTAMILVRSGFRYLEILDRDVVEPSNLNRQQYDLEDIGQAKVACLKNRLLRINPDLDLLTHQIEWTPESGGRFFRDCSFVVEAFDRAEGKAQFVEFYQDRVPVVVSGNGMAGLLVTEPFSIRQIHNTFIVGDHITDSARGHPPMAPRVTACAAKMAEIVLDLTLHPENAAAFSGSHPSQ